MWTFWSLITFSEWNFVKSWNFKIHSPKWSQHFWNGHHFHGKCLIKIDSLLISGTFKEGIWMKRFWSCCKSGIRQGIPGINPQVFSTLALEGDHFLCFSTFQAFDYKISKNIEINPWRLVLDNKKGPPNNCAKFYWNTWNQMAETMIWK